MRVLVAYASYHGATREIAARIADVLSDHGFEATLSSVDESIAVGDFDAFVIGSAVHTGNWLKPASSFVRSNAPVLSKRPVWLFSSGPLGESATKPQPDPRDIEDFRRTIPTIRDHVVFGGAFDRSTAAESGGWLEHTIGRFIPEGDFRDWPSIEAWAHGITHALQPVAVA